MKPIGVYIELKNGQFKKSNREILTLARKSGRDIYAIVFAPDITPYLEALAGVHSVVHVRGETAEYQPDVYAETIARLVRQFEITDLLAVHSARGKDLLPRVAARCGGSLIGDCLAVDLEKNTAVKPIYAGKVLAEYRNGAAIRLFTLRPNVIPAEEPGSTSTPRILTHDPDRTDPRAKILRISGSGGQKIDLAEAEIIVSGGRGMKAKENFSILDELAQVLHAGVGASRAAVDAGFASTDMQVGQTGKVVNPKLYIACGISGSIQHFVGMKTSKIIVGINKDPEAPIFKKADYGIVGDLFTIVPLLKEELQKIL
jgi:electron transfer flavoprotein alpha subunit